MTNKEKMLKKFVLLSEKKPLGVDLTSIDPKNLFIETQNNDQLKTKFSKFGQIFRKTEGLKQFLVPYYNENSLNLYSFRNAIFYNELVQIQIFSEFIRDIDTDNQSFPNLSKIIENKNN